MLIFIIKSIILLICVYSIQSDCDVCHTTNVVACHGENEYSICVDGKPTEDIIKCPEDFVCTSDSLICRRTGKADPSCIPRMRNNTSPTDIPTDADATKTISQPTPTQSTSETMKVTTTFIPRDPNTICREAANSGIFYADDPTCTTIIVCFVVKGSWVGLKKSCGAGKYFGPNAKYCSNIKPDECT